MKLSWGVGVTVAILLSFALGLLGILNIRGTVSSILLLSGLWTVAAAFVVIEQKDRIYYSAWGIIIAALSLSYYIELRYSLAIILLAIVAMIVVRVYMGRTPKLYEAATNPTPAGGGKPAAKPS